jgi:hypothetical protein
VEQAYTEPAELPWIGGRSLMRRVRRAEVAWQRV